MPDHISLVPLKRKSSTGVKAALRQALEVAEKDGCTAVAIAFVTGDGSTASLYEAGENVGTLIGAVQRLNLRLLEH